MTLFIFIIRFTGETQLVQIQLGACMLAEAVDLNVQTQLPFDKDH